MRWFIVVALPISTLVLSLAGCGGGYSTEEATLKCDQERAVKPNVTEAAYQQCVTCYEECGDDCDPAGSSPEQYACR